MPNLKETKQNETLSKEKSYIIKLTSPWACTQELCIHLETPARTSVHSNSVRSVQEMESSLLPMKGWVDNKNVAYTYMELYPAMEKNEVIKCADK